MLKITDKTTPAVSDVSSDEIPVGTVFKCQAWLGNPTTSTVCLRTKEEIVDLINLGISRKALGTCRFVIKEYREVDAELILT